MGYEYLREFEPKIEYVIAIVQGTCAFKYPYEIESGSGCRTRFLMPQSRKSFAFEKKNLKVKKIYVYFISSPSSTSRRREHFAAAFISLCLRPTVSLCLWPTVSLWNNAPGEKLNPRQHLYLKELKNVLLSNT